MSPYHLHLLTNHIPIFFAFFAAFLLAWALLARSRDVARVGFVVLLVAGIAGWPVKANGEDAEHAAEDAKLAWYDHDRIHEHEEAGEMMTNILTAGAVLALAGLVMGRGKTEAPKVAVIGGLVLSLAGLGAGARTALLGGEIRHEELRGTAATPPATTSTDTTGR